MQKEVSYQEAKTIIQSYLGGGRQKLQGQDKLRIDLSQAIVYEHDGKRLQAASLFYATKETQYFQRAIINVLSAPPSEKRLALIMTLYRDSRIQKSKWYNFLQSNLQQEVLKWSDIEEFTKENQFHPSLFCEHIMIGISRVYSNISIKKVAQFCKLSEIDAYELIENMIINERLNAEIDQESGFIQFHNKQQSTIEHFCTNLYSLVQ